VSDDFDDGDDEELAQLLDLWDASAAAFASCFTIADKNTRVVDFEVSEPQHQQLKLLETVNLGLTLKGRQMWITTITLIWQLRLCWRQPGSNCAVVMQTDTNAVLMSAVLQKLYHGNPTLVQQMPMDGPGAGHRVGFTNGSQILFASGNSPTLRSLNFNFAHFTEVKDYDDLANTLSTLQIAPNGQLFIESTAGGEDDFYNLWQDADPHAEHRSAFTRLFLCWRDHPEYRSDKPLPRLQEYEREYIARHSLTPPEASWWVHKRRGYPAAKRALFISEFPSSAEEAFRLAGDRYLVRQVPVPPADAPEPDALGITRIPTYCAETDTWGDYHPTHQYVAGIDPAPGSNEVGDPTGIVILDVTARAVCLTQELREATREHEPRTRLLLASYGNPTTNIETASEGLGMADYMRGAGLPMYHMVAFGGLNPEMLPRHGWRTDTQTRPILFGEIHEAAIGESRWKIGCRRLVKELNALCYDKRGKPAAPKNGKDNLSLALGLALLAVPQALPAAEGAKRVKEPNRIEALEASFTHAIDGNLGDSFMLAAPEPAPGDFFS
jgi:hypothetical protein